MEPYTQSVPQPTSQPIQNKSFLREHGVMLLAFLIPILFIVGVLAVVYIPSRLLSSEYDFVYATCSDTDYYSYECGRFLKSYYRVVDGKIETGVLNPELDTNYNKVPDMNEGHETYIFFHDVEKNESKEISLADVQNLEIIDSITSPDGVSVQNSYDRGPEFLFLFDSGSSYGYYLTKGNASTKLNLINADNMRYYGNNGFKFIGWVKR